MEGAEGAGKTVLVTGGSGFLGGWCLVELLRRGYEARATVRDLSREDEVRAMVSAQAGADGRLSVLKADLEGDEGWEAAVEGCDQVVHVASPFPPETPDDPDELIRPAREGTLRVLRASLAAGVKRVVVTSSSAAAANPSTPPAGPISEADWTDPELPQVRPYARSKVLAERAAWEFMRENDAEERLATILPSAILGPVLSPDLSYSVTAVSRLLNRDMPALPRLGCSWVDVRDVADLHLRAMTTPGAGGERFLGSGEFMWLGEVAWVLRDRMGDAAGRVPTRGVPSFVVRLLSRFDPSMRQIVGELDRRSEFSAEKAKRLLEWSPRPVEETIVDCAQSLIRQGLVET